MDEKTRLMMAYFAGCLDGDGSYSFIKEMRKNGPVFHPCIAFAQKNAIIRDILFEYFGGGKKIKKPQYEGAKPLFDWRVRGYRSCKKVLDAINDFVVIKKQNAKMLSDHIDEVTHNGTCYTNKNVDLRACEKLNLALKMFNEDRCKNHRNFSKQSKTVTENPYFWSYFAGLMDTDGSFSIKRENSRKRKNPTYTAMIQITMASIDGLNFILQNVNIGNVCFVNAPHTSRGYVFKFSISSKDQIIVFLKKISPFLVKNKYAADILQRFLSGWESVGERKLGIPQEQLKFRESCYQDLVYFNKYGVSKPSLIVLESLEQADRAQASVGAVQGERLSEKDAVHSVCDSLNTSIAS